MEKGRRAGGDGVTLPSSPQKAMTGCRSHAAEKTHSPGETFSCLITGLTPILTNF
jgi:hypothetical protein